MERGRGQPTLLETWFFVPLSVLFWFFLFLLAPIFISLPILLLLLLLLSLSPPPSPSPFFSFFFLFYNKSLNNPQDSKERLGMALKVKKEAKTHLTNLPTAVLASPEATSPLVSALPMSAAALFGDDDDLSAARSPADDADGPPPKRPALSPVKKI